MSTLTRNIPTSVAILVSATFGCPASAYDLKTDWSDSANPNGPWAYREGTTVLPHTSSWTAGVAFPVTQPAYLPANVNGNFLPSWFKTTSTPANFDTQIGDIVVHTNDSFNGNLGLGVANVLFTVPVAGNYQIFGNLWNASTALVASDFRPRPQDWQILVNGAVQDSGVLDAVPGHFTRSAPDVFDLHTLALNVGDTVELDLFKDAAAQAGFLVGTNLTINPVSTAPVPAPASLSLFAMGLAGLGIVRARKKSNE